MRLPRGRRLWLKIHLYLGLTAGAVLLMIAVTGSILVFSDEIDRALNPGLAGAARFTSASRLSPDQVIAAVERTAGRTPYLLEMPGEDGDPYLAFVKSNVPPSPEPLSLLVHAETGEILAIRQWGSFFVSFARRLHTELFIGEPGSWIVAGIGVLGLTSVGTGLYLWWPRGGAWRKALRFHWHRYPAAIFFELHRITGFYLLLALFVILMSGVYLAAPGPFDSALGTIATITPHPQHMASQVPAQQAARLSLEAIATAVHRHAPDAVVTGYALPTSSVETYTVYYREKSEPHSEFGRSTLWLDQYTGRIVHARSYERMGGADRLLALQILLHNGEIAGTAGKWIVFACGIALALLFVSGVYLWWVKRR